MFRCIFPDVIISIQGVLASRISEAQIKERVAVKLRCHMDWSPSPSHFRTLFHLVASASAVSASRPFSRSRALMGLSDCVGAVGAAGSSLRGLLRLRLAGKSYWELWEPPGASRCCCDAFTTNNGLSSWQTSRTLGQDEANHPAGTL